jgi:hypothetical protein
MKRLATEEYEIHNRRVILRRMTVVINEKNGVNGGKEMREIDGNRN